MLSGESKAYVNYLRVVVYYLLITISGPALDARRDELPCQMLPSRLQQILLPAPVSAAFRSARRGPVKEGVLESSVRPQA
jgi:hypothetical protein